MSFVGSGGARIFTKRVQMRTLKLIRGGSVSNIYIKKNFNHVYIV